MRKLRAVFVLSMMAGLGGTSFAAGAAAGARKHRVTHSSSNPGKRSVKTKKTKFEPRQRSIDNERATEIQQALIKAGYLTGEPSGHWDQESIAAMMKMQAANGWQTKLVPDSRALIKLGLGPAATPAEPAQTTASLDASASTTFAR